MFNRIDKLFVITTNNLAALEAISEWIYRKLGITYFIQVELFPNMTLYRICVKMREDWDNRVTKQIKEDLIARHIEIMESLAYALLFRDDYIPYYRRKGELLPYPNKISE